MKQGRFVEQRTESIPSIEDCMYHRCKDHIAVQQINSTEFTESECGACIQAYYEAILHMTVERLGGKVEGRKTTRINFLQRVDELREIERHFHARQHSDLNRFNEFDSGV